MATVLPHVTSGSQLKCSDLYTTQFVTKGLFNVWNTLLTLNNVLGTTVAT